MDPTEKGVWWKNDNQWERYSPADAKKIIEAWRNGETNLTLGPFRSYKRHPGPLFSIDLVSMKQTNLNSGLSRDIKIIPDPEDDQEGGSDEDFYGEISRVGQTARSSKNEVQKEKNVLTMIPSLTIDLQKLSTQCRLEDQCNLVLKLPNAIAQADARLTSLRSKTFSLLLEKFSSGYFIENFLSEKWPDWSSRLEGYNPYLLERAPQAARYGAFLSYLCALAEEEEDAVDRLFRIAERGHTVEGDPVEYLFTTVNDSLSDHILDHGVLPGGCGLLSRTPPSEKQLRKETSVVVCLGICKYLQEQQRAATRTPGTVIPVATMYSSRQVIAYCF